MKTKQVICWNWQETTIVNYIQKKIKRANVHTSLVGNGDDGYVYRASSTYPQIITTDAMVENVHWKANWCSPEELAAKLVAVNISDIAAMGGQPERAFITLALPKKTETEFVYRFIDSLVRTLKKYHVDLAGGDTVASPTSLMFSLTLQGISLTPKPLTRSAAMPGDLILVTGDLGAAAAGREILSKPAFNSAWRAILINRFLQPTPRLQESDLLTKSRKVHALMDCSDGLARDITGLSQASGTGAIIYGANLPVAVHTRLAANRFKKNVLSWVLNGGEDYELLFTCQPKHAASIIEQFQTNCESTCSIIGEVTAKQKGIVLMTPEGYREKMPKGFEHNG